MDRGGAGRKKFYYRVGLSCSQSTEIDFKARYGERRQYGPCENFLQWMGVNKYFSSLLSEMRLPAISRKSRSGTY